MNFSIYCNNNKPSTFDFNIHGLDKEERDEIVSIWQHFVEINIFTSDGSPTVSFGGPTIMDRILNWY